MKKTLIIGCASLLLVCSIFFGRLMADTFKPNINDFFVDLRSELKINVRLPFKLYKLQHILDVPDVEIQHLKNNKQILSYRSEFHNGSENGCVKIFCKVEGNKVTPFFVLEELFVGSEDHYYLRMPTKVSYDTIAFDLFKIEQEKKTKILSVILEKKGKQNFEISSLIEFSEGFADAALNIADCYDYVKESILTNTY